MMNLKTCLMTWSVLAALPAGLYAAKTGDEARLETEQRKIDQDTTADARKIETLSQQFNVLPETVQDLRNKGQGWGEVTIGLATAQHLAQKDPTTYPTLGDALTKVQEMRAAGGGWGRIAQDLGFKLGPVISASRHARNQLRAEAAARPGHGQMEKPMRAEGMERPMPPGHSRIPSRQGPPKKPERPGY